MEQWEHSALEAVALAGIIPVRRCLEATMGVEEVPQPRAVRHKDRAWEC
jgi:hypothetical protein